jgi:hypothetical protein
VRLSPQKIYDRADSQRRTYGERYANKPTLNRTASRIGVDAESLLDPVLRQDRKQRSDGDRNR